MRSWTQPAIWRPFRWSRALPPIATIWAPQWRSSLIYVVPGRGQRPLDLGAGDQQVGATAFADNLIYSPVTALDLGAELSLGERELENGVSGDVTRLTVFAKYGF